MTDKEKRVFVLGIIKHKGACRITALVPCCLKTECPIDHMLCVSCQSNGISSDNIREHAYKKAVQWMINNYPDDLLEVLI